MYRKRSSQNNFGENHVKAIVWTKSGPPDVLQLQEVAKPVPRDREVLIRIYATTVTTADCQLRRSIIPLLFRLVRLTRPGAVILGQELAGEIEAVGKEVTRFKTGDQVFAWTALRLGSYAEYACMPATGVLAVKPANMTYEQAAPLPLGGLEAAYFLRKANVQRGEKVLISAAGGTIGAYAVQIAKAQGAEVTAVDSADKLDMLRSIGADHVIDYTKEDFTRSGKTYDVIFDVIGSTSYSRCIRMLTPNGRYLLSNPRPIQNLQARWTSRAGGKKVIAWASRNASEYAEDIRFLTGLIEAEKVKSVIDRTYPLEQIAEAHRYVETDRKKGNVVITLNS
jgi:NADPH:quinone reductase-like Zn-dependent oxidoreductase